MIWLKACPKCKGDLRLVADEFGRYLSCYQCGYSKDVAQVRARKGAAA